MGKSPQTMPTARSSQSPGVWVVRALWLIAPLGIGPAVSDALSATSPAMRTTVAVGAWVGWAATWVVLLVPRASSLTAVRVGVPASLPLAAWAAIGSDDPMHGAVAVGVAGAVTIAVLAPQVTDAFVDGSSYGAERRFALRTPLPFVVLAVVIWASVVAAAVTGPLLVAAGRTVAGAVASTIGIAVVVAGARSLHGLSRRWLVLVPSGLVVHDPTARPDSVMAPRPVIVRLGPAPVDSDALDLTLGAAGLALELETSTDLPVTQRARGRQLTTVQTTRVLVAAARPAAVLAEAEARRLPVAVADRHR